MIKCQGECEQPVEIRQATIFTKPQEHGFVKSSSCKARKN